MSDARTRFIRPVTLTRVVPLAASRRWDASSPCSAAAGVWSLFATRAARRVKPRPLRLFLDRGACGLFRVSHSLLLRALLGSLLALRLDQAQARQVCLRLRRLALQRGRTVSARAAQRVAYCVRRPRACCVSFQCRSSARAFSIASLRRAAPARVSERSADAQPWPRAPRRTARAATALAARPCLRPPSSPQLCAARGGWPSRSGLPQQTPPLACRRLRRRRPRRAPRPRHQPPPRCCCRPRRCCPLRPAQSKAQRELATRRLGRMCVRWQAQRAAQPTKRHAPRFSCVWPRPLHAAGQAGQRRSGAPRQAASQRLAAAPAARARTPQVAREVALARRVPAAVLRAERRRVSGASRAHVGNACSAALNRKSCGRLFCAQHAHAPCHAPWARKRGGAVTRRERVTPYARDMAAACPRWPLAVTGTSACSERCTYIFCHSRLLLPVHISELPRCVAWGLRIAGASRRRAVAGMLSCVSLRGVFVVCQ